MVAVHVRRTEPQVPKSNAVVTRWSSQRMFLGMCPKCLWCDCLALEALERLRASLLEGTCCLSARFSMCGRRVSGVIRINLVSDTVTFTERRCEECVFGLEVRR